MVDMKVDFIGGELSGQSRCPINEDELNKFGYRPQTTTQPFGEELIYCIAVPITWTFDEAHQAIDAKLGKGSQHKPGKRSV